MNIIEHVALPGLDIRTRVIKEGRHIRAIGVEGRPIGEFACFHANQCDERIGHVRAGITRRKLLIYKIFHRYVPGARERSAPGVSHVPERQR